MFRLRPLLLTAPLAICVSAAVAEDKTYNVEIPAQSLATALETLAQQTGIKPFYTDNIVAGKKSPAISGRLSPQEALEQLLSGSGLIYKFNDNQAVAITQRGEQQNKNDTTTLPKVSVVGNAVYDVKDPYNQDYALPNATAGTMTDTPIMETPLNIQVISKQVLKDQQVITLADSLKNVSGVTTQSNTTGQLFGTNQNITLRGFADTTYFRNGFRLQEGSSQREMANVESVEVLKGSAAILYGQVEPGGMVNVITKQPLATPYYSAQQQFGSYNLYRTTIDATGPLTQDDTVLYRINMSYENSGSFRDNVNNDKLFLAPILKWNISPRTQATFELEYNHSTIGLDTQIVPTNNGQLMNIPRNLNYLGVNNGLNDSIFGGINWSHQFNDNWSIKHSMMANHQSINTTALYPFSQQLVGISTAPQIGGLLYQYNNDFGTYATNINLTGHFDTGFLKHTLLMGGDYYRKENSLQRLNASFNLFGMPGGIQYVNVLNPVPLSNHAGQTLDPASLNTYTIPFDQYGAFFQDQIKLPYNFHFTGGFRYQNFHQKDSAIDYSQTPPATSLTRLTQDAVTPRFGLLWQPENWLSVYSNYVESFGANSGMIYPAKPVPATAAQQWEVGAKTEFFDGRLRATLAYYDLTKTNITTPDLAPGHAGFVLTTGAVRSRGPELDIQGEILPGWNVIATYANTDIIVTKAGVNDYPAAGSRYYGVPRNTASFWNTYEFTEADLKGLKIGGGVTIRDGQVAYNNTPGSTNGFGNPLITNYTIPGYATVDLMAAYSMKVGNSKITAQLNINNLLDKYYLTNAFLGGASATGYDAGYVSFGAPRTAMGSIKVEF